MMRLPLLLSLALLAGCDAPVPFTCGDFVPYAGAPTTEVGIATEAGIPWTEGGDVSLDLGGQGGFMVQPVLSLDPSAFGETAPERACARVEIDNIDPTGGDRFTGFETLTLDLPLRRNVVTGRLETAVIFNQLRWSPLPPNTAFGMSVVVRTETFAASVMREVLLQPGG